MSPQVKIEYCTAWNYYPRAARLAEQIEAQLGIQSQLIKGGGGVFEVSLDDRLIFSKKKVGRFPEPGEIEAQIGQQLGSW